MNHFSSFHDHLGKICEIRIKQHYLGNLAAGIAAGCNRDGAVRLAQCQQIINAAPGHGHLTPFSFQRLYQLLLLFRRHSCKYRIFFTEAVIINLISKLRQVDCVRPSVKARPSGDLGYRCHMVAGNHLHLHSFFSEKVKRFFGMGTQGILQNHTVKRPDLLRKCLLQCAKCGIIVFAARHIRVHQSFGLLSGKICHGNHGTDLQISIRDGSCLIQAESVHMCQRFQGIDILYKDFHFRQPDHSRRQRNGNQKHKSLGQHPKKCRRGGYHRSLKRRVTKKICFQKQQNSQRND